MVSWSSIGKCVGATLLRSKTGVQLAPQHVTFSVGKALESDHNRMFAIQPSRWQWHKFKDMVHYYLMVGLIPVSAVIFYANIFIGPAQLQPIPEDYVPKHWEYYRHPITRFIVRYVHSSPQLHYEKFCHWVDEEGQRIKLRRLENDVMLKMAERQDYQAFYYRPLVNKYLRNERIIADETYNRLGDQIDD